MSAYFSIDPDAKLDYGCDWTSWLRTDDTIVDSSWTITPDDGPVLSQSTFDDQTTTIWVEQLRAGATYALTNHIVSFAGREDDRTLTLSCENR